MSKEDGSTIGAGREARSGRRKTTISLSDEVWTTVQRMAEVDGDTATGIIRDAISLLSFAREVYESGGKLIIERPRQEARELFLFLHKTIIPQSPRE